MRRKKKKTKRYPTDLASGLEERDGRSQNAHGRHEQHGGEADEREHLHGDQTLTTTVATHTAGENMNRAQRSASACDEMGVRPSVYLSCLSLSPGLNCPCCSPLVARRGDAVLAVEVDLSVLHLEVVPLENDEAKCRHTAAARRSARRPASQSTAAIISLAFSSSE